MVANEAVEKTPPPDYEDTKTEEVVYADLPDEATETEQLSLILGDAVHNLRSALDHLAWELVVGGGGNPIKTRADSRQWSTTAFPIYEIEADFNGKLKNCLDGATDRAIDMIRAMQQFRAERGSQEIGDVLRVLSLLDNIDKHRFRHVVAPLMYA